jgi:hypothetical protein
MDRNRPHQTTSVSAYDQDAIDRLLDEGWKIVAIARLQPSRHRRAAPLREAER